MERNGACHVPGSSSDYIRAEKHDWGPAALVEVGEAVEGTDIVPVLALVAVDPHFPFQVLVVALAEYL